MEGDEKGEATDGSNPQIRPDTKSKGVTQLQLNKFQELQRRRLQLTSKSKNKKPKAKGRKTKVRNEALDTEGLMDDKSDQAGKDQSIATSSSNGNKTDEILSVSPQVDVHPVFRKKKLHWGLDSKERWERKANM